MILDNLQFESERLITRELQVSDASSLFEMYSDFEAMRYRGSKAIATIKDAFEMIANQLNEENGLSICRLGIRRKSDNELIGTLLLKIDQATSNQCEIGFSFGKEYWGQGFGKETLALVESELKRTENIEEIHAWCVNDNLASVQLFEKANYSKIQQETYPESTLFVKSLSERKGV